MMITTTTTTGIQSEGGDPDSEQPRCSVRFRGSYTVPVEVEGLVIG